VIDRLGEPMTARLASSLPVPQILVAVADAETRRAYSTVFGLAGCEVIEASDGRQALAKALMRPPALVLTEIRLPFLDGCSLCEILRRDRATVDVPVLVITDDSQPAMVERARQTGADSVLLKPATPEAIVNEARRLIGAPGEPRHRAAAFDASSATPQPIAGQFPGRASGHRITQARALQRFSSKTPPVRPPALECPSCAHALLYEVSHVGGVNNLHREQWDYFSCPAGCGTFQYRQRTRSIRRVE
jgi:twitching motility two-component system response regulator PilG